MLKFLVSQAMVVDKVHERIYFKQSNWLAKYIGFKTQKRNQATKEFERDFHELLIRDLYGKTMENVRNRISIRTIRKMG